MSELGDLLDRLAATVRWSYSIISEWDAGFVLVVDGRKSVHDSFAEAARALLPSTPVSRSPASNAFDDAYRSEIDTRLSFDGNSFAVELQGGSAASFRSFDEVQLWLDADSSRLSSFRLRQRFAPCDSMSANDAWRTMSTRCWSEVDETRERPVQRVTTVGMCCVQTIARS